MSITNQFVNMVNKAFNTKANQVVQDLRNECNIAYPKGTGKTAKSFRILSKDESMTVGTGGLLTSVTIGSTLQSAWYANYGNAQHLSYFGGKGNSGMPNYVGKGYPRVLFYDGEYHVSSRTYEGAHFVEKVVAKWNG